MQVARISEILFGLIRFAQLLAVPGMPETLLPAGAVGHHLVDSSSL